MGPPTGPRSRRRPAALVAAAIVVVGAIGVAGFVLTSSPGSVSPNGPRTSPGAPVSTPGGIPAGSGSPPPSESPEDIDTAEGIDGKVPTALPAQIELYAGAVSVIPGQAITLHVSTPARTYQYTIERLDATLPGGGQIVARATARAGHDYRSLATFDTMTREARANWPVTDTIATKGWSPGVYIATATDSAGSRGQAIFVVRTEVLRSDQPAFVWSALTYEAYNLWGGANLYDYAAPRAVRVSFERPYALDSGKGYWTRSDDRILAWLQKRGLALQYTTDYDLSLAPPSVAPKLLIFARHSEYVGAGLFNFVEQHVNVAGDMNLLNFGSNSFYWQVRLASPRTPGAPMDIVCYKSATADPLAAEDPDIATTRWRLPPLNRPEGAILGAQYDGVLGNGFTRFNYTVSSTMPPSLLAGTGWRPGTLIRGLLLGEGDLVYPGSGGIGIMDGHGLDTRGRPLATSVTIRVSPTGARVFDAGTFAWGDGFPPPRTPIGVTAASFDRFNRNLLAWLGFPTTQ